MVGWPGRLAASTPSDRRRATTCSVVSANMAHSTRSSSESPGGASSATPARSRSGGGARVGGPAGLEHVVGHRPAQAPGASERELRQLRLHLPPAAAVDDVAGGLARGSRAPSG